MSKKQCHYKHSFSDKKEIHKLLYRQKYLSLYGFPSIYDDGINGIIGPSQSGKTTLLKILSGNILSIMTTAYADMDTVTLNYISKVYLNELSILYKDQKIKCYRNNNLVIQFITDKGISKKTILDECPILIDNLMHREMNTLDKGELQMIIVWCICNTLADVYIFDEPFNYLNIYQKLCVSEMIMKLKNNCHYIIISDNDITFMEYVCDNIIILNTNLKKETIILNTRLFHVAKNSVERLPDFTIPINNQYDILNVGNNLLTYNETNINNITIKQGFFHLNNSISIIIGPSQSGKSFFLHWIKNKFNKTYSVKNQELKCPWYTGIVSDVLKKHIGNRMINIQFNKKIIKPLEINKLYNKKTKELSLSEKHILEIVICLGKQAQIYFIDGLSKHLDYKQRLNISLLIKNYIVGQNKSIFIIDDDLLTCTTLCKDTNSSVIITHRIDDKIIINTPQQYEYSLHNEFDLLFYDTTCGRPILL